MIKKLDFSAFDLGKFDLTRKYDNDYSPADGIAWRDHVLLYAIAFMVFLFIVWAGFATLDEVVRGDGKVIPSNEVQVIQNLEGGIIEEMLVREGDAVEAGQPLLRLNNIQARSDFDANNRKYYGILAAVIRLQAEADGKDPEFSGDVAREAPESVAAETAAFDADKKQLQSQIDVLQQQLSQKQQEITELEKRIANTSRILKLSEDERKMVSPMVERGSSSRKELLQLDREIAQHQSELDDLKLSLPRAEAAMKEAMERIDQQSAGYKAEAQRQLSERTNELNTLKQTLAALKNKSARTEITSPVHGTVKDVKTGTVGGVVRPGETIMEIVPLEDQLLVEGRIKPADIAFIYPGQKAVVRVSAYDFSIYGSLEGKVVEVSPDSITNEKGESFYRVKVRTTETKLKKGNKELSIIPGMQATLDFITGKKTVMKYILKPFIKASQMAMTER
jgi:adhesin transport system membrane fusion protein